MSRPDSVNGPGQRDLERAVGPGSRRAELRDDAQTVRRGDRLEDAEAVLLVVAARAQPTVRRQWLDAGQVPIELGGEEARSAHLAVGHDLDPGVGLVAQREIDGVIEDLARCPRDPAPRERRHPPPA